MLAPSGDQFEITAGGYRAVVTEGGAALRLLEHAGRPLVDGFAEDAMSPGGRGQLLMPWPNRIRDGAYSFGGRDLQLPLTEPRAAQRLARAGALGGLDAGGAHRHSVSLVYRLMAQTGYPWTLDLHVLYDLSADGLTVTQTATNLSAAPAPYASGAHPYLARRRRPGRPPGADPAGRRPGSLVDDRMLRSAARTWTGRRTTSGSPGRSATPCSTTRSPTSTRDEQGVADRRAARPGDRRTAWRCGSTPRHRWLQVFSADDVPGTRRGGRSPSSR